MKALFGFLTARWFLALLGTAALAALVWFIGPLFGFAGSAPLEPEAPRWWVIGILFALWALWQIGAAVVARRRNRRPRRSGPPASTSPSCNSRSGAPPPRRTDDRFLRFLLHSS